ncbi:MAG: NAD-glutamate dehydrogenase domain-containing protein [Candidatus Binataceae bacterium]
MASESIPQESSEQRERQRRLDIFTERLFERLPSDLSDSYPVDRRRAIAESAFEFFQVRAEPLSIRVRTGATEGTLVVETAMDDRPFIVDSILELLHKSELHVRLLLHPLFQVARTSDGAIVAFEQATAGEHSESFTHIEIDFVPSALKAAALEREIAEVLHEVRAVTSDFAAMTRRALEICDETAAARGLVEIRDFLRWLVQDNFVFLGYRRYRVVDHNGRRALVADKESGLGILRDVAGSRYADPVTVDSMDADHRTLLFDEPPLIVGKSRAEARVHRRAPLDDITLRRCAPNGEAVGFDRFLGLFSARAYAEEAQHVPVLRAKLTEVLEAEHALPGTHDYREFVGVFNSFPKEELFRARVAELRAQMRLVLDLKNAGEVRLSLQSDPVRGNVIALVIMPREHFSASVRMSIQEALAHHLGGKLVYYYLALGEGYTARLHFCFSAPRPSPAAVAAMESEVVRLARTWDDFLRDHLLGRHGLARGHELAARWCDAFSAAYRSGTPVEIALHDIERLEALLGAAGTFSVDIHTPAPRATRDESELRMYELREAPVLSELVPTLQNFGISVVSEEAHELHPVIGGERRSAYVQSFLVRSLAGTALEKLPGAGLVAAALTAVRDGHAEDDALNVLTLNAGLSWREVALMRAYLGAAVQMKLVPARIAANRPLLLYPQLARILTDFFMVRFDPELETAPEKIAGLRAAYHDQCGAVENIADDRFARTLLAMVEATVRTNYFQAQAGPLPYLALKFESSRIPNLPDTAPLYEIHVSGPRMEGCHLRGGKIARGGIRHSDRPDDYRTEILDLMKTQTVKNAIIVPVGSKGGFVIKARGVRAPDRDTVVAAYTILINAMLDLTDNVADGTIVHPARVRVLDSDDPYLVVAADKGTATFSDIANEIAESRGYWLGDAFASGGKHGYDHKEMGITARGAWESARRHLREMGREIDRGVPITMVGIGDMSGDVFGNGLLRSENLKLIAAFDHRHIFIDPDPDPKVSFAERKRLYQFSASSWADYRPEIISQGGGVFRRGQKRIALSPEARAALGCDAAELDADSLVQAILRAGVDLLYNGGIGTYVRAGNESDGEVGDHANDNVRVVATELRCKVVVEGGNLGFTQRARIEYALGGGRINNDAIDNSAGVDMSDHEVNLKILLAPMVASGGLSSGERNRRLAAAAEEVAESVLHDNRDQVLSLSLEQLRSRVHLSAYRDHLTAIEQAGIVRRDDALLPTYEELRDRRARFPGLTRPELAMLTAYTKIDLTARLQRSLLVDDPYLVDRVLRPYFPPSIAHAFAGEIPQHGLRREIVATRVVNEMVDLMGSVFVFNLQRDTGIEADEALRAWLIAAGVLELPGRAAELKINAAELTAEAETGAFLGLERAARRACTWAIAHADPAEPLDAIIARFEPALRQLAGEFEAFLAGGEHERFERSYRELRAAVHHEQLAHELARLAFADHLLNVLSLAFARGSDPSAVARIYFGLSERIEFAALEGAIDAISSDDRWERRAARDLAAELAWARLQLCRQVLDSAGDGALAPNKLDPPGRERRVAEVDRLMRDLRTLTSIGLPPLQVTVRALSRLASGVADGAPPARNSPPSRT